MSPQDGPYRVEVGGPARRNLQRLPAKVAAAIVEFMTGALAESPHRLSKSLRGDLVSYRIARRGDYRVLLRIDEARRTVLVVAINHRAHVYRRR